MSYCRFSSDDFACDLYCYEDVSGGWTTHVAGNRIVGDVPSIKGWHQMPPDEMAAAWEAQHKFLDACERQPIGLPHDGEMFNDPTLEDFRERLIYLRGVGYRFPDYVLEAVDEEIAEAAAA